MAGGIRRYLWTREHLAPLGAMTLSGLGFAVGLMLVGSGPIEAIVIGVIFGSLIGRAARRKESKAATEADT